MQFTTHKKRKLIKYGNFPETTLFLLTSDRVIWVTLDFYFYCDPKQSFEEEKLPQLLATYRGKITKYLHPIGPTLV
jgi:hypothetical protein